VHSLKSGNGYIRPEIPVNNYTTDGTLSNDFHLPQVSAEPSTPLVENIRGANQILSRLLEEDLARMAAFLEPVWFSRAEEIHNLENGDGFVHFPLDMVVSQLSVFNDGSTAEVALIGNEGVIGLNYIFNSYTPERWTCVAVAGGALRMRAKEMKKEFDRGGALQHSLLDYAGTYIEQVSQRAVCNSQHKIEERLASWLLMIYDRTGRDMLLTQEQISSRLGTRRSSITLAAISLQEQNIISYLRGRIRIINRDALEAAACECYKTLSRRKMMIASLPTV
jgi:hypothetical protein